MSLDKEWTPQILVYKCLIRSLFLVDDLGDAGGPYAGMTLPSGATISNSQCTITGAASSASGSGNTLTLMLNMSFSAGFVGNKITYMAARDLEGDNSGW